MATTTVTSPTVRDFYSQGDSLKALELKEAFEALVAQINSNVADLEARVDALENP